MMENCMKFIGTFKSIELTDGSFVKGECFTVDPVTSSLILITDNNGKYCIKVILAHAVKEITDCTPPDTMTGDEYFSFKHSFIDELYGKTGQFDDVTILKRRDILLKWFENNHLPVKITDTGMLSVVNGVATVEAPYTVDCCRSTNTIVLDRIMKMIKSCPDLNDI